MRESMKKQLNIIETTLDKGFSLIELMIVVALAAIFLSLATPSFTDLIKNNRMTSLTNELVSGINIARQAAISRGVIAIMCQSNNANSITPSCVTSGVEWAEGYIVYTKKIDTLVSDTDAGNDYSSTDDEIIYRYQSDHDGKITATQNNANKFIRFNSEGLRTPQVNGEVRLCDDRSGDFGRTITISVTGRISNAVRTC